MKQLDERTRAGLLFAGKLAVAVLAVTVTISVISYLFTWKADQSLQTGSGVAANAAASGGFSIGHFLIRHALEICCKFHLLWTDGLNVWALFEFCNFFLH